MNCFFQLHFRFNTAIGCALSLAVISTAKLHWEMEHCQKEYIQSIFSVVSHLNLMHRKRDNIIYTANILAVLSTAFGCVANPTVNWLY